MQAFIEAWATRTTEPLTVSELINEIHLPEAIALKEALPIELQGLMSNDLRAKLPYFLRANRGKVFGGLRLDRSDEAGHRSARWSVRPKDSPR